MSRVVLRAQVFGDVINPKDRDFLKVWDALPHRDKPWMKIIVLGDLVHKNSPEHLWQRDWVPTYGSLPTCKVWSVLGNHGWGWGGVKAALGRTYWKHRWEFHEKCTAKVKRPKYCWMKKRPGWLILGLDSEHPRSSNRFLLRMVRRHGKGRKVLVLVHRSPILPPGSNAPKFKGRALKRNIGKHADLVMSGHSHRFWRTRRAGTTYIVAGTGAGKGWADLMLLRDGGFHVRFVKV